MRPNSKGTLAGCIVWIIVFASLSMCILPLAMLVGGVTSTNQFAIQTIGSMICPQGTVAKSYSYATTTTDEYGNTQPSTAYELHCVDENGLILKKDPVFYAFMWIGISASIGLVIAALLAFALATPAGLLISRLFNQRKISNITEGIEPT